jgi:hypothetical protein
MPSAPTDAAPNDATKSKKSWISRLWSLLPLVISIIALSVSIRQWRVVNEATTTTVYDRTVSMVLEIDRAHLNNPKLRPFFYENRHLDKKDPDANQVEALAEVILDCFEILLTEIKDHPNRYPHSDGDRAWIVDSFKHSEVLRDYLDSHKQWFAGEIFELRQKAI